MRFSDRQLSWILTLSWRRPLLYRNKSIDLLCKSIDWFLYDNGLCHERVNADLKISLYVCVHVKTIPWKFRILFPKDSRVICAWVCKFLKKQTFDVSHQRISQKVKGALMWNVQHIYFRMKTKVLVDVQICIGVPLRYSRFLIKWKTSCWTFQINFCQKLSFHKVLCEQLFFIYVTHALIGKK